MANIDKTALVFGSTGLVGSELLKLLINTGEFSNVKIFVRKKTNINHPKVQEILVDFDELQSKSSEIIGDVLFICLGTTMAKAGSKDAFYKVDYTYCYEAAKLAAYNRVGQVVMISSIGANSSSSVFYSKVKGEIENDISQLAFESVNIVRPSLLLGDRKEDRLGEKIFTKVSKYFNFIFFGPIKKYKPILAIDVAKAMIAISQNYQGGNHIFESEELQKLAINS